MCRMTWVIWLIYSNFKIDSNLRTISHLSTTTYELGKPNLIGNLVDMY